MCQVMPQAVMAIQFVNDHVIVTSVVMGMRPFIDPFIDQPSC